MLLVCVANGMAPRTGRVKDDVGVLCLMVLGAQGAATEPGDVLLAGTVLGWHREVKHLGGRLTAVERRSVLSWSCERPPFGCGTRASLRKTKPSGPGTPGL